MKKFLLIIMALLIVCMVSCTAQAQKPAKTVAPKGTKILVYYFMNNYRCPSCKKIEAYTHETVTTKFADDVKKGLIAWEMVNVDEPANKHFVKEYNIFTKQVVLVEMKDGAQTRWKNLGKIWDLLGDKAKFTDYIEKEIKAFKGGA